MYKISDEDISTAFARTAADSKKCLHEFAAKAIGTVGEDGDLKLGLYARSVQHDAQGNMSVHDFIITPEVMEKIARELASSAAVLGVVNSMKGIPGISNSDLLDLLVTLDGENVTDLVRDASKTDVPEPRETS